MDTDDLHRARENWPARFRANVATMERLLGNVPLDETPTPALDESMDLTEESAQMLDRLVAEPGEVVPRLAAALKRAR